MPETDGIRIERPSPDTAVAVLTGEHDLHNCPALKELLDSLIAENRLVVADVSEAEFADSSVIKLLVDSNRSASEQGHTFRVQMGTDATLRRVFEVAGVLDALDCASTREEALMDELPIPEVGDGGG